MNRCTPRSLSAWLLPAALFTILVSTGCGSSASPEANASETAPESAQPAIAIETQATEAAERERLEQQVRDLQAQLERREETAPARTPSLPPAPRPGRAPVPPALEAEVPPSRTPPPPPLPEPQTVHLRLEAGTELHLSLREALSSETSQPGDPVIAVLAEDVLANGVVALPDGSEVYGSVAEVTAQKKIGGQARLALRFDKVRTPDGYEVGIESSTELLGKAQGKKDGATIGGSAAGGALLGRILSKNDKTKGTVLGAAVGAAVGTAVASKNAGDPVELEAGASVTVALSLPVHVSAIEE